MPIYQGNTEINTQFVDGYGLGNIFLGTNLVQSGLTADNFISASGGTITTSGSFKIHVFDVVGTSSFVVTNPGVTGSNLIEYLIVGGGGSGGLSANNGDGGGAGGLLSGSIMATPGSFPIIVGAGGIGNTNNIPNTKGSDSSALGLTALGGGKGQNTNFINNAARNGGSGAGNGTTLDVTQGNNGGTSIENSGGSGGGGAGQVGQQGTTSIPLFSGNGGNGIQSSIITYDQFNSALWYAGGGGAGGQDGDPGRSPGTGGFGGAGNGGAKTGTAAQRSGGDASRNIGAPSLNAGYGSAGGGCGAFADGAKGGNGFQGVVIVKYQFK